MPPTLGKEGDGYGALQFTTARYVSGAKPRFDKHELQSLLRELEVTQKWSPADSILELEPTVPGNFGVYADYLQDDRLYRVWYVSDGENLALVTYTGEDSEPSRLELDEATEIVCSIQF
jgi:hypothetical protein